MPDDYSQPPVSLSVSSVERCGGYAGIHVSFEGLGRVHSRQLFSLTVSVFLRAPLH